MTGPAIEIDRLTRRFGDRAALDELSLCIAGGQVTALLGPNGGGKSTLFRILATLLRPTHGAARVLGWDVVSDAAAVRRAIGVTFQHPSLDGLLTVRENLLVHAALYGLGGAERRKRVCELLGAFGVADRAGDRAGALSGGLQRRVEIAKSMLNAPRVLLLDEPSTGLDPAARRDLRERLRRLADEGVTVFLTTHLMEEAEAARYVVIVDRGRRVAQGAPADLCREVGADVITLEADDPAALARHVGPAAMVCDGLVRVEHEAGARQVVHIIESYPGRIRAAHVSKPTLGDVFLHHTGRALDGVEPTRESA